MKLKLRQNIAIFFTILFMGIISAPSLIMTMDDSIDVTCFFGINEEEENESFKLVFEAISSSHEDSFLDSKNAHKVAYIFKAYAKPHLNQIFPPPELV
jgi:hypothetical protein